MPPTSVRPPDCVTACCRSVRPTVACCLPSHQPQVLTGFQHAHQRACTSHNSNHTVSIIDSLCLRLSCGNWSRAWPVTVNCHGRTPGPGRGGAQTLSRCTALQHNHHQSSDWPLLHAFLPRRCWSKDASTLTISGRWWCLPN